jgi:hypothetical protein
MIKFNLFLKLTFDFLEYFYFLIYFNKSYLIFLKIHKINNNKENIVVNLVVVVAVIQVEADPKTDKNQINTIRKKYNNHKKKNKINNIGIE